MTPEILISEGRRLARKCVFLRPTGNGPVAATWHHRDDVEIERTGHHCWITVDTQFVPGQPKELDKFLSVFTDERKCDGGRVEFHQQPPCWPGIALYASEEPVLPPIEVVFLRGSDSVGEWLAENSWPRNVRYNNNFKDRAIVDAYEHEWSNEYPLYREDETYAVLGGWHWPCADHDWYELADERLMVLTVQDSEPWVEAWRLRSGEFKVIQRIT